MTEHHLPTLIGGTRYEAIVIIDDATGEVTVRGKGLATLGRTLSLRKMSLPEPATEHLTTLPADNETSTAKMKIVTDERNPAFIGYRVALEGL